MSTRETDVLDDLGWLNVSAHPSENFAHARILNNSETIRQFWHVDVLKIAVSPGFCLSNGLCSLQGDRLDHNEVGVGGRRPDEFNFEPHHRGSRRRI